MPPSKRPPPVPAEQERGNRVRAEETHEQRLGMLENAIGSQRSVEFAYALGGGKRIQVQPLHLLRNRDPMKLIAVELSSGHRNEYPLDQMQNMRVVEEG